MMPRFGTLLVNARGEFALYLSHRCWLTVPVPGRVRAVEPEAFGAAKFFIRRGRAVAFYPQMIRLLQDAHGFADSFALVRWLARPPPGATPATFAAFMRDAYGAELRALNWATLKPRQGVPATDKWRQIMEGYDVKKAFNEKYEEARAIFGKRPNILVCGYTGCGKSSLARAILGDIVPTDAIGCGAPKTMGYDCYENDLVRLWDSKGLESGESEEDFTRATREFVSKCQGDPDVDNHIHLVWYAIQGCGARVTPCDKNLISRIFNPNDVIVVLTKSDITKENQKAALRAAVLDAGVTPERVVCTSDAENGCEGCTELMNLSYRMLPEAYRDAFMDAQRVDREAKVQAIRGKAGRAKMIIGTAVAAATGAGAVPIPISDAAILMPVQVTMIASLAGLYGLRNEAISQSALPFVARAAGMYMATSILKLIPGLGSVINAGVAGALTGAMGWYVKNNFEKVALAKAEGRPVPDIGFDIELFKQFYQDYRNGGNA